MKATKSHKRILTALLAATMMFSLIGAQAFAAAPTATAAPPEILATVPEYPAFTFDVTQSQFIDAYTEFALGVSASGIYFLAPFPSGFSAADISWSDNTPGTLSNIASLDFESEFDYDFGSVIGEAPAYEAYFSSYYANAPDTGPYSVKATYTADVDLPGADFTFVVTNERVQDDPNVIVGGLIYAIYDPDTGLPSVTPRPFSASGNDYYSGAHIGRSYVTALDGFANAVYFQKAADSWTSARGFDGIESITINGVPHPTTLPDGWLYRVYKADPRIPGQYNVDPMSKIITMDDYKLSEGDYVVLKFGDYYDDELFPDIINP
ncbi:MAG: hypothetical protein LBL49_07785 [Clostridiales Family XIII bacterium]|jgi:hypothetical protein|nr:hypothetical protein [Clostridiales Family XIII bacterium]